MTDLRRNILSDSICSESISSNPINDLTPADTALAPVAAPNSQKGSREMFSEHQIFRPGLPTPYYEHGGIYIYHADCRDVLPLFGPVDLLLTDPPYGIGESSSRNATRGKPFGGKPQGRNTRGTAIPPTDYGSYAWDARISDDAMRLILGSANRAIVWGGNFYSSTLTDGPGWLVWDKQNSGDFADCELAWTNLPQACRIFRHMWNGMLRASERDVPRCHPTQKPIALMNWCLSFAPEANTVIDPFMGSGPTLIACKNTGRIGIGIDKEERYCEIAAKRLSQEVFDFNA